MGVYVIAEAGVNHNGSLALARKLADAAKAAGADCVKYQTFRADRLTSRYAEKADYQKRTTEEATQQEMLRKLELSREDFTDLKKYCDKIGITFLSTPYDLESIRFLDTIDMPFWKIPSGEVTNYPYLTAIAATGKPVVMSTGMCTTEEIAAALEVLRTHGAGEIRLLHCNTEYPTPYKDVNLMAMRTMREQFGVEVGYSDHSEGIEVPIAAAALGACIIEKHFTLDRNMPGPDHRASLEPAAFTEMVTAIRHIEQAQGNGEKSPSPSEEKNKVIVRKSIVAKTKIRAGEILTEDNITTKRPGTGLSPMLWPEVIGTAAIRDYDPDEMIER